jgi:hypothetical protein
MCNFSHPKLSAVERHGETHVLMLIEPEKAGGFMSPLLKKELAKMKPESKKQKCLYC